MTKINAIHYGGRSLSRILRAPFSISHYVTAINVFRYSRAPFRWLLRYLSSAGDYPITGDSITPTGRVELNIKNKYDLKTFNEVFFREDYGCPNDISVFVDVGANIGIASLFFLTRNTSAFGYLYEPDPKNVARVADTLARQAGRFELIEEAVGVEDGTVELITEPSGRFGTTVKQQAHRMSDGSLTVPMRDINRVLSDVVAKHGAVDVLKIDIEGLEVDVVNHIDRDLLAKVRLIVAECEGSQLDLPDFDIRQYGSVARCRQRRR